VFAEAAFIGLAEVTNVSRHRAYNEWHQLDHRPENLALPGVIHGERWVRSPDCAEAGVRPSSELGDPHYLNMYWFRAPADRSRAEWSELAERSLQWGRRPDIRWTTRAFMGFFRPVKGYVNPRVLVSPEALVFRPNRGVYVSVTRVASPRSPAAEDLYRWYDTVRIPDLVSCTGAAGAWTFAEESAFAEARDLTGQAPPPGVRVLLVYLDADPLEFMADLAVRAVDWAATGRDRDRDGLEEDLLVGPLRAITPWQWDWFDPR